MRVGTNLMYWSNISTCYSNCQIQKGNPCRFHAPQVDKEVHSHPYRCIRPTFPPSHRRIKISRAQRATSTYFQYSKRTNKVEATTLHKTNRRGRVGNRFAAWAKMATVQKQYNKITIIECEIKEHCIRSIHDTHRAIRDKERPVNSRHRPVNSRQHKS